jgi:hypothetical protein
MVEGKGREAGRRRWWAFNGCGGRGGSVERKRIG